MAYYPGSGYNPGYNGYNPYQAPFAPPYMGGMPPQQPPPMAVNTYQGLPPTGPTPYQDPYAYAQGVCPSTAPYPNAYAQPNIYGAAQPPPPFQQPFQQPQENRSPYNIPPTQHHNLLPRPPIDYNMPPPDSALGYGHPVQVPGPYGRRKALLIGINYINDSTAHLSGCINDTNYLKYLLIHKFSYNPSDMLVLTDDQTNPSLQPTKANIMNGFRWLVEGAQPGDSLFFGYSGHGGQTPDEDGDEDDGLDETILPVDYETAGQIIDDDIHLSLAMKIPEGAKLTALMDCCHSGTGIDLPYSYETNCQTCDRRGAKKVTRGDVICFSGCRDDQTSADSESLSHVAHSGVLTYTFVKTIEDNHPNLTYDSALKKMQELVREKRFRQITQLSSGRPLDMSTPFTL